MRILLKCAYGDLMFEGQAAIDLIQVLEHATPVSVTGYGRDQVLTPKEDSGSSAWEVCHGTLVTDGPQVWQIEALKARAATLQSENYKLKRAEKERQAAIDARAQEIANKAVIDGA